MTCNPDEFAQLVKLGVFTITNYKTPENAPQNLAPTTGDPVEPQSHRTDAVAPNTGSANHIDVNIFFEDISPSMAKIAIVVLRHGGTVRQSDLVAETGISGAALRRPNGALSKWIRRHFGNQIQCFFTVKEPDRANGLTDRVFTVDAKVLRFIRDNEGRFPNKAHDFIYLLNTAAML